MPIFIIVLFYIFHAPLFAFLIWSQTLWIVELFDLEPLHK
jgi:hypothetical protein